MIQSLLRSMELLELLKETNHKYSIAELSEATGLPPSTIHRILQTFCEKKYVIRDEHAHTYQLGPALISLGRAAANNVRIQEAALPILKNLSYNTREDSYLIIQVGDKGLVLDKMDGPNHLKVVEEFEIYRLLSEQYSGPAGIVSANQPRRPGFRTENNTGDGNCRIPR